MRRIFLVLLTLLTGSLQAQPQPGAALAGRVDGKVYIAPGGTFRIAIPVLPELGGAINDTPNVVTFQDQFNVHVSIGAFPMDASQRWELSTRGLKDYLHYFFDTFVMSDFQNLFPNASVESSHYLPDLMKGAYVAYTLLPGGSMFADRRAIGGDSEGPPVAKRGNLVFVRSGMVYVISTELAERVIERSAYKKTPAEEDEILHQRLEDIVKKMEFTRPATDS
ncbi:MAG: hypothetical protein ABI222_05690 [Opitutaceae bacterium]